MLTSSSKITLDMVISPWMIPGVSREQTVSEYGYNTGIRVSTGYMGVLGAVRGEDRTYCSPHLVD